MWLSFIQAPADWIANGKTLTAIGALALLFVLFIWKGIPWIRTQLEQKDQFLREEIAEARKERDEQRTLRTQELKEFVAALKRQDDTHKKGFAAIVKALEKNQAKRHQ